MKKEGKCLTDNKEFFLNKYTTLCFGIFALLFLCCLMAWENFISRCENSKSEKRQFMTFWAMLICLYINYLKKRREETIKQLIASCALRMHCE